MEMGASVVKTSVVRPLRWLGATLLDQLYPPVCLACDAPVASADALCSTCFRALRSITAPLCPVLGLPFEASLGPDARSAEAIADPPPFERARSAVVYNDVARALVGKLKYGDRPELARFCARLMAQAGHEIRFDPSSAPDLIDYLTVATVSGLETAILGAGIGALLGLLFEQPGTGLAIGAGVGLVAGASRGVRRVQAGWRVQAVRELNGEPRITISAVGST